MYTKRSSNLRRTLSTLLVFFGTCCMLLPSFADDTEVFFGQLDPTVNERPNVLFILDTSGSMREQDGVGETRLERMKQALYTLFDSATNVNMGLMRFNGSYSGGPILFPVTAIDQEFCSDASCGQIKVTRRISKDLNDVSENLVSNLVATSDDVLSLGQSAALQSTAVGLRFEDLGIPQGALITEASIEFAANADAFSIPAFTISAQLEDDAPVFTGAAADVSARSYSVGSSWFPGVWAEDEIYVSADISTTLQTVVNRAGWCGGNSIVLKIEGSDLRDVKASSLSLSNAPRLSVVYDSTSVPATGGCITKTLVSSVSSDEDDAEENLDNDEVNLGSSDLELPYEKKQQLVGIRFDSLSIPQGATITNAYVEFQIDEYKSGDVTLRIQGEDADDANSFESDDNDITDRATTTANQSWVNPPANSVGQKIQSPELTSIAQEIVNRAGWTSGNAMVFLIDRLSGSGRRIVESYDGDASAAPKLHLEYTQSSGAYVASKVTTRDKLKEAVAELRPSGGTPIVDAYYEGAQYYLGGGVDYGSYRGATPSRYNRISHPDSYTGGTLERDVRCSDTNLDSYYCEDEIISGSPTYVSPITSSCQTSNIVILTDGEATSNTSAAKVRSLTGLSECEVNSGDESCGRSLADWLDNRDNMPGIHGTQNIATHTIGFNLDSESSAASMLSDLATRGGGKSYSADTADQLDNVFQSVLREVLSIDTSFVAPGATVNQFNRLTHRNDIYFAVFKPQQTPTWLGNLKRYEIGATDDGDVVVMDFNDKPAVDANTGFFAEESQSWWSDSADGNFVGEGGAAGEMIFDDAHATTERRTFTFTGDTDAIPSIGVDLTEADNVLHKTNSLLTTDMLGLTGMTGTEAEIAAHRDNLLDWAVGVDILDEDEDNDTTDWRAHIGDPMHSRPVIVNYGGTTAPESTIFMSTNEGYLHAIDREEGNELYAYVPQQLLPNLNAFMENSATTKHPYGLDGAASVWMDDLNGDGTVNTGEQALLYMGMRRGGSNYYALDVSDRLNPKLAWIIKGGADGTPGFEELGESWSSMIPSRIKFEGVEKDVLIFAGGYDINQDADPTLTTNTRTTDSIGRGIFIVDAKTGALIWSGLGSVGGSQFFTDMEYSIPSNLRIVDINFDGLDDQIYVADTGGQLWRFDINNHHVSGDLMTGGVIANLSSEGVENERRFYYEPDVALIGAEGKRFLSISIGSGWRAHPLDQATEDRFYMIKSTDIHKAPANYGIPHETTAGLYVPVTESDLVNVSDDITPESNDYGWYIELEANGEKVLGDSITINNQIVFSSFKPDVTVGDCSTAIGGGSVYVVDVLTGAPSLDLDGDGTLEKEDRETELAHGGIPPEPAALITEYGPTILLGPEQPIKLDFGNLTQRTFWVDLGPDGESAKPAAALPAVE